MKASTSFAGGTFSSFRPVYSQKAEVAVRNSHFLSMAQSQIGDGLTLNILPEPLGAAVTLRNGKKFGMSLRLYDYGNDEVFIPGFSLLHEEFGKTMAEAHGMLTGKVGLRDPNDVTADSLVLDSFLRNHPMPKYLRYYFQEDLFSKVIGPENQPPPSSESQKS